MRAEVSDMLVRDLELARQNGRRLERAYPRRSLRGSGYEAERSGRCGGATPACPSPGVSNWRRGLQAHLHAALTGQARSRAPRRLRVSGTCFDAAP